MPPVWKPLPIPSAEVIASNEIFPLVLIGWNGFATTTALPAAPTVNGAPAWIYCDGTNNTPDLRVVNPKSATGAKNWQLLADSDILATIEITGATPDIRALYGTLPLNKRVFYATTSAGVTWGAPTIGILRGITEPHNCWGFRQTNRSSSSSESGCYNRRRNCWRCCKSRRIYIRSSARFCSGRIH